MHRWIRSLQLDKQTNTDFTELTFIIFFFYWKKVRETSFQTFWNEARPKVMTSWLGIYFGNRFSGALDKTTYLGARRGGGKGTQI